MSDPDRDTPAVELLVLDHLRADARLIRVQGAFDGQTCAELLALVDLQCVALEMDMLVLDLRELADFGTNAVLTMVELAVNLAEADIGLSLVASDELVGSALERAGIRALFELHGSVDEALDVP